MRVIFFMEDKSKTSDYLTKTLILQLVICVIIFVLLLAFSKINSSGFNEIKHEYSDIIEENITKDEALETFKKIEEALSAGVESVIEEKGEDTLFGESQNS